MICRPRFVLSIALPLCLAACTKGPDANPEGPARLSAAPSPQSDRAAVVAEPRPAADDDDWRQSDDRLDASSADGTGPTAREGDAGPQVAEDAGAQDPRLAARAATEASVDSALGQQTSALRRCFASAGAPVGASTIRFRVHRSGYVVSSRVGVADEGVRRCVTGVLSQLRVRDMKTDSIEIERTLRFTRKGRGGK